MTPKQIYWFVLALIMMESVLGQTTTSTPTTTATVTTKAATGTTPMVTTALLATESPQETNFSLTCHELYFTAYWTKAQYGENSLAAVNYSISLLNSTCNSYEQNSTHLWLTSYFTDCGAIITDYNDTIKQENTATVTAHYFNNGIIHKDKYFIYTIHCSFNRQLNISSGNMFNTSIAYRRHINKGAVTDFSAEMFIYTNQMFASIAADPLPVAHAQPLYIGISEKHSNPLFKFVVHKCFAAPSNSPKDILYQFLRDRCPLDPTFAVVSSDTNSYNFRIEAFQFLRNNLPIYIHCTLHVCQVAASSGKCDQRCPSRRRRRDIEDRQRRDVSLDDEITSIPVQDIDLISQKIVLAAPRRTCAQMVCPAQSTCIDVFPPFCRCKPGNVLLGNTCSNERIFTMYEVHLDMLFLKEYENPQSQEYINLVRYLEKEFLQLVEAHRSGTIAMVSIVDVRNGSIIVDMDVVYHPTVDQQVAFDTIVNVISDNTMSNSSLKFITDRKPTMKRVPTEAENSKVVLVSVVIAVIVGIPIILFIAHKIRERSCGRAAQAVARGKVAPSDNISAPPPVVNTGLELDGGRKRVEPLPFY